MSEPIPSKIPVEALIEGTDELGAQSKLRKLIVRLASKIDGGFSAMHMFLVVAREEISGLKTQNSELISRVNAMESRINTLESRLAALEGRTARAGEESTAQMELAHRRGRESVIEEQKKEQLEWAKLSSPAKVATITGACGLAAAIIASIVKLLTE
jgi:predicted  nucleic acid-binding Zn-ribbon protein